MGRKLQRHLCTNLAQDTVRFKCCPIVLPHASGECAGCPQLTWLWFILGGMLVVHDIQRRSCALVTHDRRSAECKPCGIPDQQVSFFTLDSFDSVHCVIYSGEFGFLALTWTFCPSFALTVIPSVFYSGMGPCLLNHLLLVSEGLWMHTHAFILRQLSPSECHPSDFGAVFCCWRRNQCGLVHLWMLSSISESEMLLHLCFNFVSSVCLHLLSCASLGFLWYYMYLLV